MKKDFTKFQSDFYAEVENRLPKFYKAINSLMVSQVNGVFEEKSSEFVAVDFEYVDVTGKGHTESILIHLGSDVVSTVGNLNNTLMEAFPAWGEFTDLDNCIATAIFYEDETNNYLVEVEGKELSVRYEGGIIYVDVVGDEDGMCFDYDMSKWRIAKVVEDVKFQLYSE